jgi:hypothetical protein
MRYTPRMICPMQSALLPTDGGCYCYYCCCCCIPRRGLRRQRRHTTGSRLSRAALSCSCSAPLHMARLRSVCLCVCVSVCLCVCLLPVCVCACACVCVCARVESAFPSPSPFSHFLLTALERLPLLVFSSPVPRPPLPSPHLSPYTPRPLQVDYVEDYISVSSYPLSGAVAAGKLCNAFEDHWDIL